MTNFDRWKEDIDIGYVADILFECGKCPPNVSDIKCCSTNSCLKCWEEWLKEEEGEA